ncbi:hypothetical protein [Mucilaginibacter sp. FT3.2]|uniref:hypothetical protein n=1 Tax=Mucilaginibacter sp. FT3.2 TaxID=2723090 RepID=UPI0016126285|nr:hypothetical protein [Mucilaginibacter sp. FT3.2]MBB6234984.1 hypothetical protein [Mucilaginibacter sp. FT3.2]
MTIEQTDQGILIKTTAPVNMKAVQKIIDYFSVMEIVSRNQGTEEQAGELSNEVDKKWWQENKHRFLK